LYEEEKTMGKQTALMEKTIMLGHLPKKQVNSKNTRVDALR